MLHGTKELIGLDELEIANLHGDVLLIMIPVQTSILNPIEVGGISNLILLGVFQDFVVGISLIHVNRVKVST